MEYEQKPQRIYEEYEKGLLTKKSAEEQLVSFVCTEIAIDSIEKDGERSIRVNSAKSERVQSIGEAQIDAIKLLQKLEYNGNANSK